MSVRQAAPRLSFADGHRDAYDRLTRTIARSLPGHDGTIEVIEAGCGRAWTLGDLGAETHITGIDLDEEALSLRVEQEGDLNNAIHGDLMTVDVPSSRYHLVYNSFVLEHLEQPDRALDRFFDWLVDGGLVALILPDKDTAKGFATRLSPFIVHVWYYRWVKGRRTAGQPGYEPYRTFYHPVVGSRGITRYCEERGHEVVAQIAIRMTPQDEGRFTWTVSKAISLLTLGRLRSDYCNLVVVLKKH